MHLHLKQGTIVHHKPRLHHHLGKDFFLKLCKGILFFSFFPPQINSTYFIKALIAIFSGLPH